MKSVLLFAGSLGMAVLYFWIYTSVLIRTSQDGSAEEEERGVEFQDGGPEQAAGQV